MLPAIVAAVIFILVFLLSSLFTQARRVDGQLFSVSGEPDIADAAGGEAVDSENVTENESIATDTDIDSSSKRYIFVGDSRYVGMKKFAQSDDVFIAQVGEGYYFLASNMNKILEYIDKNSILIVGLGVNDYASNYKNYIKVMNELADTLDCKVYYMLINPVDEDKEALYGYSATNEMIDKYNALIKAGFNSKVGVIDTNTYLKEDGFYTSDGLHYDDNTYKKVYNFLKSNAT
jgi:hypothetical protein